MTGFGSIIKFIQMDQFRSKILSAVGPHSLLQHDVAS